MVSVAMTTGDKLTFPFFHMMHYCLGSSIIYYISCYNMKNNTGKETKTFMDSFSTVTSK